MNFKSCWPPPWQCCLWFFSLYTAVRWDACGPQKGHRFKTRFCLFGNWVSACLKLGYCELIVLRQHISWLDCTVVIVGIIFWHPVRLFATTNPPSTFLNHHRSQVQKHCRALALFLLLFFCSYIVRVPVSAWIVLMIPIQLFVSVLTHLYSRLLTASKSTKRKQLSAAVAAKVNTTINPPFTFLRLQCLDNSITSGQTGRSCEAANHDGGDFWFLRPLAWEQFLCPARRSATRSLKILRSPFLFQTQPENNKSGRGHAHKNYSRCPATATLLLV